MSFLFTFRLPNLPFLNPFATRTVEEEPSESIGQPSWDIHSNSRISKRGLYSQPMQQQQPDLINEEAGSIINSRKRSREEIEYDSSLPNMYQGRMRRLGRVEYDEEALDNSSQRFGKKRKLGGIAETILSTALSVAVVSTAVGYTAYRLWRDGGTSGAGTGAPHDVGVIDSRKLEEDGDDDDWKRLGQSGSGNGFGSGLASPPPPYYAREDSWTSHGERVPGGAAGAAGGGGSRGMFETGELYSSSTRHSQRERQGAARAGPKRAMAKVHRTRPRSRGAGSGGGRQDASQQEEAISKAYRSGRRDERVASPKSKLSEAEGWRLGVQAHGHHHGSGARSRNVEAHGRRGKRAVAVVSSEGDGEEYEEGSSRLDEQMDWMSERLRGLIADGKKALGKEIVLGTGSTSDEDGIGHVDDGEIGWYDLDVPPVSSTAATTAASAVGEVVRQPLFGRGLADPGKPEFYYRL